MTRLTVLFDFRCGLCQRARRWLEAQPKFLDLEFIAAGSDHARYRFPTLPDKVEELVVVGDDSAIYRGDRAWIMCLYALAEYREWALRLASPRLLPLARAAFQLISENRIAISRLFSLHTEDVVAAEIARWRVPACVAPEPATAPAGAPGSGGRLHVTNEMREWLE
jgi:predicted DCC family thiol-disulfide oxidoreductase YuxK